MPVIRRMQRSSLPTIPEEPRLPVPRPAIPLSQSAPGRILYESMYTPTRPAPMPTPTQERYSSSLATSSSSTWGTFSERSLDLEDECAVIDDSDEEFGPPNSVDSLVFSRSPPKASQSLSLLGLMLANVKDLRKRTRRSYTSRGGSTSASGNTDCDLDDRLEVMSPRGRRVRRRKDSIPLSCSQENTVERHPGLLEWEIAGFINGGAAAEEDNVRPREDHADPDDGDVESNADEEEEEEGEEGGWLTGTG